MREIKFRAWNSKSKVFHPADDLAIRLDGELLCLDSDLGGHGIEGFIEFRNSQNYVFLQYTDLKDKNGKEIYEGDIIGEKEVYFDKKTASFDLKGSNLRLWASAGINEIQGNVYENPERGGVNL